MVVFWSLWPLVVFTMEKMRTRSQRTEPKEKEPKENLKSLPFIGYHGKLHYYTDSIDCAMTCDKLLSDIEKSEKVLVIGFDMEWPFNFQMGPGKTALIQMSPSLDECFLFHVASFKKLPLAFTELLSHRNIRLAGVNIKNDIHKLARDFPGINSKPMLDNCIDSSTQAKIVVNSQRSWSMEKLINYFFKMQINKDKRVRQSKWNVIPLTEAQQRYAAIDAYASLKLYLHLKDLEQKNTNEPTTNILSQLNC